MNGRINGAILTTVLLMVTATAAHGEERWRLDVENGLALSGRNDVRIPGDSGSLFSLTGDLQSNTAYFWRVRADARLGRKHVLSALAAPLQIDASGRFDHQIGRAHV